ncbi:MAG: hypothetical protein HY964_06405 [Ignavibacteriales bacterium]|nr:hypothetical protein [Ignavibacteriales bacterium]
MRLGAAARSYPRTYNAMIILLTKVEYVMKNISYAVIIFMLLLFSFSCKETPPEPGNGTANNGMLTVEDVGVTDAVLRLRMPGGLMNRTVTLKRQNTKQQNDTATIYHSQLTTHHSLTDTLIIDESLQPKHSYRYVLTVKNFLNLPERCYADIVTMDTTSHTFTWQIDTLGDGNSSVLHDVAIVNDTLVYAVGEIYKKDSTGQIETEPYGVGIWDGKSWQLQKITAYSPSIRYVNLRPQCVLIFSSNNVWLASGGVHHWNGDSEYVTPYWINTFPGNPDPIWITNQFAQKLWGTSSNNNYVIGTNGALAHYDGNQWQKIESGTTLDIEDIMGSRNAHTSEYEILAVASKMYSSYDRKILKLNGSNVQHLSDIGINYSLRGVWFISGRCYYVVGDGMYKKRLLRQDKWQKIAGVTNYYSYAIRGNDVNDVICVGGFGEVLHFNGFSWRSYRNETKLDDGNYISVSVKGDHVFVVGNSAKGAHVLHGIRKSNN